jgi:hypothetical protein
MEMRGQKGLSKAHILASVEGSLQRLQTVVSREAVVAAGVAIRLLRQGSAGELLPGISVTAKGNRDRMKCMYWPLGAPQRAGAKTHGRAYQHACQRHRDGGNGSAKDSSDNN